MSAGPPPGQMPPGAMPGGGRQPSEEEMRAAIGQMRAQPVDALVAEVLSALLNQAQVKLGRNDGRLLLDLVSMLNDGTRGTVDEELTQQVDDALGQLRMAQVEGERELVAAAQEGHVEQNDLPRRPAKRTVVVEGQDAPAASAEDGEPAAEGEDAPAPQARPEQPPRSDAASRLWVPGR